MMKVVKDPFRDGKFYLRKNDICYRVKNVQSGDGLFLSPQHSLSSSLPGIMGDGLCIKQKGGKRRDKYLTNRTVHLNIFLYFRTVIVMIVIIIRLICIRH